MRRAAHYCVWGLAFAWGLLGAAAEIDAPVVALGERLFRDERLSREGSVRTSCASCHPDGGATDGGRTGRFGDARERSPIAPRGDGRATTPRHASSLVGSAEQGGWGLLHWDGEFASMKDLVRETFLGRNFGWLPEERAAAIAHLARVVRQDVAAEGATEYYATLFSGGDVAGASDEQIVEACVRSVTEFVRTLRFSRDGRRLHDGSPYDAFLAANRLPRAPNPGETPHEYARRLHAAVAALRKPVFIDDLARTLVSHDHPFRFGEEELRGMRIFFRGATGYVRSASAGNCAECHVPPHFTDFGFHNTGATQDRYDAVHGLGAFAKLVIPTFAERAAAPELHLPPSAARPRAPGAWRSVPVEGDTARADLGLWNIYANPVMVAPQAAIERQLNRSGTLSHEAVLASALARFKTPTVRNTGAAGRLLHDGGAQRLEEVVQLYRRMSDLARAGAMRNPPREFAAMSLAETDVAPLIAFLRSLNED